MTTIIAGSAFVARYRAAHETGTTALAGAPPFVGRANRYDSTVDENKAETSVPLFSRQ